MEKYLNQLLDEMQKRGAISPMHKQDVSSSDPLIEFMYNFAHGGVEKHSDTIEAYCGIRLEQLPPQERLSEVETERLVDGITNMWLDYGIGLQVPESTPACILYKLMREIWQEKMFLLRSGGLTIDFCSGSCPDCDLLPFCDNGTASDWFNENPEKDDMTDEPLLERNEENFISGIYNYCNRRCAHCDFKERCRLFFMQHKETLEMEDEFDPMAKIEKNLQESLSLLKDIAEQAFPGMMDDLNDDEHLKSINQVRDDIYKHKLFIKSDEYEKAVDGWIEDYAVFKTSGTIVPVFRQEVQIITWYQSFIGVKVFRALSDLLDSEEIDEYDMYDANGTAKAVLQALDESKQAWIELMAKVNEGTDRILDFINDLNNLQQLILEYFPAAEHFKRPGLDEKPNL